MGSPEHPSTPALSTANSGHGVPAFGHIHPSATVHVRQNAAGRLLLLKYSEMRIEMGTWGAGIYTYYPHFIFIFQSFSFQLG